MIQLIKKVISKLIQNPPEFTEAETNRILLESCKVSLYDNFQSIINSYMMELEDAMVPVHSRIAFLRILTCFQNEFVQELLEVESIAEAFNAFEFSKVKISFAKQCYFKEGLVDED